MKPKLTGNLGNRRLFTEKGLDKLTDFEGNLTERAMRRCSMSLGVFDHDKVGVVF